MAEAGIEHLAHLVVTHAGTLLGQLHKVVVGLDDLLVERHSADVDLMLQLAIEVGSLLEMDGHVLACMAGRILEETGPESLNVLRPEC